MQTIPATLSNRSAMTLLAARLESMTVDHASALRFAYRSIYLNGDDSPEDRRLWSEATVEAQGKAARDVHSEHGGTCPDWALAR